MKHGKDKSDSEPAFVPVGSKYRCSRNLKVRISDVPNIWHYAKIPAEYQFDGASIPRCLWWLIGSPFEPDLMVAACVHDWYCDHTSDDYQTRVIGDAVFFALLQRAGVSRWRRVLMYLGVRLHSFLTYGRK